MSERLSRWFANAIRSWPFGLLFVGWTALWWAWLGAELGDPHPWLIWSVVTTFLTEVDLVVYGIYQRLQSEDDTRMQRNQLDTMRLIVATAEQIDVVVDSVYVATQTLLKLAKEDHDAGRADAVVRVVDEPLDMEET